MRGFSLFEMAIVLAVVGLLIGSIIVPIGTQVAQRQQQDSLRSLETAKEALVGYSILNGRLPRPAVSATDGTERVAVCATEADCTGFIPWTIIGVPKVDAYGKLIRYSVTPALTVAITLTSAGTKTIQSRALTSPFALSSYVTLIPMLVYSHGANNYGTSEQGNVLADNSATNVDEDVNAVATTTFIYRQTRTDNTTATGGEYDDLMVWMPITLLTSRMVGAGKLP
jgi:prepilin-type N-terminal cleavage/methylation domain-containing protein